MHKRALAPPNMTGESSLVSLRTSYKLLVSHSILFKEIKKLLKFQFEDSSFKITDDYWMFYPL